MEDVTLKRRALTLWAASRVAVRMDTREMALPAQVTIGQSLPVFLYTKCVRLLSIKSLNGLIDLLLRDVIIGCPGLSLRYKRSARCNINIILLLILVIRYYKFLKYTDKVHGT